MKSDDKEKFDRLQQEQRDLDESYRQSKLNKKERENKINRKDIIDSIMNAEKKSGKDLVSLIIERKRKEMIIQKENEEYLKEIQKKL